MATCTNKENAELKIQRSSMTDSKQNTSQWTYYTDRWF